MIEPIQQIPPELLSGTSETNQGGLPHRPILQGWLFLGTPFSWSKAFTIKLEQVPNSPALECLYLLVGNGLIQFDCPGRTLPVVESRFESIVAQ